VYVQSTKVNNSDGDYKLKTNPESYTKRGIKGFRDSRIEGLPFEIPESLNS
jgi:hypothetical protein